MHKTLTQTLLAAFCAILAARPLEGGGVMISALRNTVGGKAWVNPYANEHLVLMWDAEWNAGGGKHDTNKRLVDLSGNGADATLDLGSPLIGTNYIQFDGASGLKFSASAKIAALTSNSCTIQIVGRFESVTENEFILFLNPLNTVIYSCYSYRSAGSYGLYSAFYTYGAQQNIMQPYPTYTHQYTLTSDSSLCKHYVNNTLRKSDSRPDYRPFTVPCTGGYIGYGKNDSQNLYLRGKVNSIRLFNSVLNADILQQYFDLDKARFGIS